MKMIPSLLILLSFLVPTIASAQDYPKDIKVFTQLAKADEIVDVAKKDLPGVNIEVFFVDRYEDIMNSINSNLPLDELKPMSEEQRLEWAKVHMKELAQAKTLKNMKSKLGVSYTRLFDIQKVPAVLMDNYYLTYGMSVSESIDQFIKNESSK
ncbi:DUF1525 domain-containing protein [Vibrio sp. Y2-5]|uniref:DUF1525 domain-containing protein n=1 Tax=Vibrio sp. Y2-5 TaxID=2743977 RepID=UPI001660C809|nr:DUF1525 domain-containing protein [Vibrio sp. Y2-5]MBD0788040.1 DUF1525 domain-containing protein [Vibrio sp. Y2-5]